MHWQVQQLESEVASWPGVTAHSHRFAGREFRLGDAEIGHVHVGGVVDIPFTRAMRDAVLAEGLAEEHRWVPDSGWTTFHVRREDQMQHAIWLMRLSFARYAIKKSGEPWKTFEKESIRLALREPLLSLLRKFVPRPAEHDGDLLQSAMPAPNRHASVRERAPGGRQVTSYLCVTCGTQYPPAEKAPAHCPICEDERQYVGLNGQEWISLDALRKAHRNVVFEEGERLWGIHMQPKFAIGQRALLLQSAQGGFLWDCVSLIDEETVGLVTERGGIRAMAISHPHYYTSMVEWSRAFGGIPIYVHEADRKWVQHSDPAIEFWSGETKKVADDLTLIRVGGHFDGFQVLHWASGEKGSGVLMTGDMPQVCPDRQYVSFMYSYPNFVPVSATTVRDIVHKLEPYAFSKLHGAWPRFAVAGDPKEVLRRSAERYLRVLGEKGL